jgi:hypothetical protein
MSLLRISRTIHAATIYHLYRHITIPHSRTFRKFLASITEYPSLGAVPRRLDFSHFNPSTIFSTDNERAKTENLTSAKLLQCLERTTNLQEFLAQEYIDNDLSSQVLWKLFTGLPRLQAIDFCGCSSTIFKNSFHGIMDFSWPDTLPLTKLSFHRCLSLSSRVFETILPRLGSVTHLDVAGTRVTDVALQGIPSSARITHLNLDTYKELSTEAVVGFVTSHPAVTESLVYLSLAVESSHDLLLGKHDMEMILSYVPRSLRSLSLKGSKMDASLIPLLEPLMHQLEELAVGRDLKMKDVHRLFYLEDGKPRAHSVRYLDISDVDVVIGSASTLLASPSAPLQVIEVHERTYHKATKLNGCLVRAGWTATEFGRRYWLERIHSDGTNRDNRARWWRAGAKYSGMRKVPVADAEVRGMYAFYMFGRRL